MGNERLYVCVCVVVTCSDTEGSGGKCIVHEENANWMQRRGRLLECIKGSKAS